MCMSISVNDAKKSIDTVIKKSRVHLYKPIQIAEILFHSRVYKDVNINDIETYRVPSRAWRDTICLPLLGRICTSSARFQDNLFDKNAVPPEKLKILDEENKRTNGAVEAYIYNSFIGRHEQLQDALSYCLNSNASTFYVSNFIDSFWREPGLKRSLDKIYEIIVYALFSTLVEALDLRVEIFIDKSKMNILSEFNDFANKVMCLETDNLSYVQNARVYRVGVTNAADRGLDMYSNWGPAIQIKHMTLDLDLAESIVSGVSSDKVVIVCKDAERKTIQTVLNQIGWTNHIQSIVTENDLIDWYEKALRGKFSSILAKPLLACLCEEIGNEFPSVKEIPQVLIERNYEHISDDFWK